MISQIRHVFASIPVIAMKPSVACGFPNVGEPEEPGEQFFAKDKRPFPGHERTTALGRRPIPIFWKSTHRLPGQKKTRPCYRPSPVRECPVQGASFSGD